MPADLFQFRKDFGKDTIIVATPTVKTFYASYLEVPFAKVNEIMDRIDQATSEGLAEHIFWETEKEAGNNIRFYYVFPAYNKSLYQILLEEQGKILSPLLQDALRFVRDKVKGKYPVSLDNIVLTHAKEFKIIPMTPFDTDDFNSSFALERVIEVVRTSTLPGWFGSNKRYLSKENLRIEFETQKYAYAKELAYLESEPERKSRGRSKETTRRSPRQPSQPRSPARPRTPAIIPTMVTRSPKKASPKKSPPRAAEGNLFDVLGKSVTILSKKDAQRRQDELRENMENMLRDDNGQIQTYQDQVIKDSKTILLSEKDGKIGAMGFLIDKKKTINTDYSGNVYRMIIGYLDGYEKLADKILRSLEKAVVHYGDDTVYINIGGISDTTLIDLLKKRGYSASTTSNEGVYRKKKLAESLKKEQAVFQEGKKKR